MEELPNPKHRRIPSRSDRNHYVCPPDNRQSRSLPRVEFLYPHVVAADIHRESQDTFLKSDLDNSRNLDFKNKIGMSKQTMDVQSAYSSILHKEKEDFNKKLSLLREKLKTEKVENSFLTEL